MMLFVFSVAGHALRRKKATRWKTNTFFESRDFISAASRWDDHSS